MKIVLNTTGSYTRDTLVQCIYSPVYVHIVQKCLRTRRTMPGKLWKRIALHTFFKYVNYMKLQELHLYSYFGGWGGGS